ADGLDEHLDLERAAVLRLVDRDVLPDQFVATGRDEATTLELHEAEQDRIVLVVEPAGGIVLVGTDRLALTVEDRLALLVDRRDLWLRELLAQPVHEALDVARGDVRAGEALREHDRIGQQLGP